MARILVPTILCQDLPRSAHSADDKSARVSDSNKANGPDGISSELAKAGGGALAVKHGPVYHAGWSDGCAVLAWRGGRYVELWKGRKSARKCSSYRGSVGRRRAWQGVCEVSAQASKYATSWWTAYLRRNNLPSGQLFAKLCSEGLRTQK